MEDSIFNEHNGQDIFEQQQLVDRYHWLNESEKLPFEITCKHVIHFTENEYAKIIGTENSESFSFKASNWKPFDESHYFVWWGVYSPDGLDQIKEMVNIEETNRRYFKNHFGMSSAFNGNSLYGPIGFCVLWKDILEHYSKSRNKELCKVQLKMLGTFKYSREIMYTILVCIEGDVIQHEDNEFHLLENESEAFRSTNNGEDFIWKVYSTTSGWAPDPTDHDWAKGSWDHLSFAFYFPDNAQRLTIPPNLCSIKTKSVIRSRTRNNKRPRTFLEMKADDETEKLLNEKINQSKKQEFDQLIIIFLNNVLEQLP